MNTYDILPWAASAVGVFVLLVIFVLSGIVRYVGNNRIAIVEKLWSGRGSISGGLIALKGQAGFQPGVLRGGFHFFFPFQYRLHVQPLVTIPQGQVGYVFARDGAPLNSTQTLARNVESTVFEDTRQFLESGGQKGPQRKILREGTYAINLAQFVIIAHDRIYGIKLEENDKILFDEMNDIIEERNGFGAVVIRDGEDSIGVVTVHDGPSLPSDQIIAPTVGNDQSNLATFHNNFQDPEAFLAAGGKRGRQLQVLVEGSYFINRLFATVEKVAKTIVEVGHVGVVVSYTGELGVDTSGVDYRHGELVARGNRGVWSEPLLPGKYAFNPYAGKILLVPTTNFILKWDQSNVGPHKFDENLSEVSLITKDAFEPILPLSVVVHIDYRKAPLVVQRFGDIKKLVEQTLDPMVSAYFKNIAQTRTLIELLQDRSEIQQTSAIQMKDKFSAYSLELQEVLIGTPRAAAGNDQIEQILNQLRQRQLADEKVGTYERQVIAAQKERSLREAEAQAKQQTAITESALSIQVQENQGKANLARSQQEANQTRTLAQAEADRTHLLGEGEAKKVIVLASAEAERVTKVGLAQAEAITKQVEASGGAKYQLARQIADRFAEALEKSGVDIVPKIAIGGGQGGEGGGANPLLNALMAMIVAEKADLAPEAFKPSRAKKAETATTTE